MPNTKTVVVVITVLLIFLVGLNIYTERNTYMKLYKVHVGSSHEGLDTLRNDNSYIALAKLIQQRNTISRQLNMKQQKIGQYECQNKTDVSSSGGWCAKSSKTKHQTDKRLIPALADFFKGKYVASFGDGPGQYKKLLLETGLLKGYDAFDGAPFSEETSEGRVKFLDLTLPQYGLPLYDWVMSLEVAEHIHQQYEKIYIDNVVRHAKEGVILSWAVPGQPGHHHVNNRPFKYVKDLFDQLGFDHDLDISSKLKNVSTYPCLKRNINVYRRRDISKMAKLKLIYI